MEILADFYYLVVAPSLLPWWSHKGKGTVTAESYPSSRQIEGSSNRASGCWKVTSKSLLQLLVRISFENMLEERLETTFCDCFRCQIHLTPCSFRHWRPRCNCKFYEQMNLKAKQSILKVVIIWNRFTSLTVVPDVPGYIFRLPAPRIEGLDHRFKRVVGWLLYRGIHKVRLLIDLLVVSGVPWGCFLVVRVDSRGCRWSHDVGAPFLSFLLWRWLMRLWGVMGFCFFRWIMDFGVLWSVRHCWWMMQNTE